jgi:hypothetical protein
LNALLLQTQWTLEQQQQQQQHQLALFRMQTFAILEQSGEETVR